MTKTVVYTLSLSALLITACRVSEVMEVSGDNATIHLKNGSSRAAELMFLKDSLLVVVQEPENLTKKKLVGIPLTSISSIEIEGYVNRKWETTMIFFQIIPTGLFALAAASADADNVAPALLIFGLPTAIVYIIFEASTPEAPSATAPFDPAVVDQLRKYLRFPQGLTDEQLGAVLGYYQQSEIQRLP